MGRFKRAPEEEVECHRGTEEPRFGNIANEHLSFSSLNALSAEVAMYT